MTGKALGLLGIATAGLVAGLSAGCGSDADDGAVGSARLAVLNAPADATCLKVVATGSRTVTRDLALTPGQSTVFQINLLPLGQVAFAANAYAVACAQVTPADVPRWVGDPVTVTITAAAVAEVNLFLRRNGRANVNVDFEQEDAGPPPSEGPVPTALSIRITSGSDDVEEHSGGSIDVNSSDLELGQDLDLARIPQVVGLRFQNVTIPPGSVITNAYVQFVGKVQTDANAAQSAPEATRFVIKAQKGPAGSFTTAAQNLTSRPLTTASVTWANVPLWSVPDEVSPNTRTPSLVGLVQEVVGDPCWIQGSALAFRIDQDLAGSLRSAFSANASSPSGRGPTLVVEYLPGTPPTGTCMPAGGTPPAAPATFLVPSGAGMGTVTFQKLLDVGEAPAGSSYRLAGIPDGMGAYDNGDGTFTLLVNHEIGNGGGSVRAHGANGAFVSKWVINKATKQVVSGSDLIQNVATWNRTTGAFNAPAKMQGMGRFCSADLPESSALFNPATGLGYQGRIFFNGEEIGVDGRPLGHVVDGPEAGITYELPKHGRSNWENIVLNPATGDTTLSIGMDDSSSGQLFVYKGTKTSTGNAIEKAGLMNGTLYGVRVIKNPAGATPSEKYLEQEAVGAELGAGLGLSAPFELFALPDTSTLVANATGGSVGQQIESICNDNKVTKFLRTEDGSWDPNAPNDYYFVSTDTGRLFRLRFTDRMQPELGGTVTIVVNTSAGVVKPDNIAVTPRGEVIIQEDPGNIAHVTKIWRHVLATGVTQEIGQADPVRFGATATMTQDEESSGVIYLGGILGAGWFAVNVQAHTQNGLPSALVSELVENGQLLLMHVP